MRFVEYWQTILVVYCSVPLPLTSGVVWGMSVLLDTMVAIPNWSKCLKGFLIQLRCVCLSIACVCLCVCLSKTNSLYSSDCW